MKNYLAAVALAATLAQPAAATTFPTLTTIYVGSGVSSHTNSATSFHCSNVSGVAVSLRFLLLDAAGGVAGFHTADIVHGRTYSVTTRETNVFVEDFIFDPPLEIAEGVVNVEATNSAIFCTAKVVDHAANVPTGFSLPLVRVNPHPGTVE